MSRKNKKKFEEMYEVIDQIIKKRQMKWKLKAIAWFDFQDIEQMIKLHIYNKWHLWDQSRAIEPWINRIVTNQLRNIIRNNYSSFAKPCLSCSFNQNKTSLDKGIEDSCGFTPSRKQCNECPLFAKWEKTKKSAYDLKIPVSLENHKNYHLNIKQADSVDFLNAENRLHNLMKNNLSDKYFFIYKMFFIDCLTDDEVARFLKFRTSEKGRKAGYKQIKNLKKLLYLKAKEILQEHDIFSNE
jgi:hypothetical protein